MEKKKKANQPAKHPGGRPTDYKAEYCDAIINYFDRPPQQTVYRETFYADGTTKSKDPITLGTQLPTFQGFAHDIGVNVDTLREWEKVYPKFSAAYAHAKSLQEKIWLVNGMGGQYNSQFAQFFGKNCLGYKDKTETTLDGSLSITDADRALLEKAEKLLNKNPLGRCEKSNDQ